MLIESESHERRLGPRKQSSLPGCLSSMLVPAAVSVVRRVACCSCARRRSRTRSLKSLLCSTRCSPPAVLATAVSYRSASPKHLRIERAALCAWQVALVLIFGVCTGGQGLVCLQSSSWARDCGLAGLLHQFWVSRSCYIASDWWSELYPLSDSGHQCSRVML